MFEARRGEDLFQAPRYLCKLNPNPDRRNARFRVMDSLKQSQLVLDELLEGTPESLDAMVKARMQALHPDRLVGPVVFAPVREWLRFVRGESA